MIENGSAMTNAEKEGRYSCCSSTLIGNISMIPARMGNSKVAIRVIRCKTCWEAFGSYEEVLVIGKEELREELPSMDKALRGRSNSN
jgi:hypothetical protein